VFLHDGYRVSFEAGKGWKVNAVDPNEKTDPGRAKTIVDVIAKALLDAYLLDPFSIPMTGTK
jgi:hypothetical protein